jgi:hypothetical protein
LHIEKNVMDNILGTILDIKGKKKKKKKAHKDLSEMSLRHTLHPFIAENGKIYMLPTCHMMSNEDKTCFLKVLQDVRVPMVMP